VAQGSSYPTLTLDVNVATTASSPIGNSASVTGAGTSSTGTTGSDSITVEPSALLSVTKSHTGTFTQGQNAQWNIVVNNGAAASSITMGTTTVVDLLPSGYSLDSYSGAGWSCTGTTTVTCTSTLGVSGGSAFPTLELTVSVPASSPTSVSNTASAYGGGDTTHTSLSTAAVSNTDTASVAQVPATIVINGNQTQSATVGTAYGSLAVTVKDAGSVIIPNYSSVTFTAGTAASGASGTFSNGTNTISVSTNGSGVANPGTFTANDNSGAFSVTLSTTTGTETAPSFSLTNTAITPTFTWSPPSTIIFGSAGTNVLNASVSCTSCGTISYTATPTGGGTTVPITSTVGLAVGTYNIVATFNPSTNGYATTTDTQQLTVSGESVWVVNSGGGTAELAGNGYAISPSAYAGANAAVAIDGSGNVWTAGTGTTLLEEISQTGIVQNSISSGGGLDAPTAITIDGNSQIWITNGNNSVSLFSNAGAALSPSGGFTDPSLSTPSGIAVDVSGSVWIANQGNNSLTRVLGAAAPAAPLSTAAANKTTGEKP
jgi:hypothetical protein